MNKEEGEREERGGGDDDKHDEEEGGGGAGGSAGSGNFPSRMVTLNDTPVSQAMCLPYFCRREPDGLLNGGQPSRTARKQLIHAGFVIAVDPAEEDSQFIDKIGSKTALLLPSSSVFVVLRL